MKIFAAIFFLFCSALAHAESTITVGSKIFTESYILAEVASQLIEDNHHGVDRKIGLGSTGVLFESLKAGAIDVYPDYTGTIAETILKKPDLKNVTEIRAALKPLGLTISDSLGFNNTYALAVRKDFAQKYNLRTISDLRALQSNLHAAFSYEFMDRKDGYQGMTDRYQLSLPGDHVSEMEHSLVYRALNDHAVDVIEVYSTDANVERYSLVLLQDDLKYFPVYEAVWVARLAFVHDHPEAWQTMLKTRGSFDEKIMRRMNASADIDHEPPSKIAARFLQREDHGSSTMGAMIFSRTLEHSRLVGLAVLFSIFIGIPLGVFATRSRLLGQIILLGSSLVQTIPALALLCFLIPVFGIGFKPALVALCLYSLLPVVLNTFTALRSIDERHLENARALGLNRGQILRYIELPLASPAILTGVKTALIVGVGTATLAALIGAGGYGALIISGLSMNDVPMILAGAVPAALMALIASWIFGVISRLAIPKGLRKSV